MTVTVKGLFLVIRTHENDRMAAYRQTHTLTACIAGVIDGERTIPLLRRHRNDFRQLVVSIASTERKLLESSAA